MAAGKKKRAFIGNLRPRPNLDERLYHDLFVPHCLAVKNYPGSGITVVSPKTGGHREQTRTPSAHALVEFGDVQYAIQVLDGVQYDGRTLRISREKTNFKSSGNSFGSSRWAGSGAAPRHHQMNHKGPNNTKQLSEAKISNVSQGGSAMSEGPSPVATIVDNKSSDQQPAEKIEREGHPSGPTNDEFEVRRGMSLSQLMEEYGERDPEWKKEVNVGANSTISQLNSGRREDNGMLAPFGKASIHLEVVSFGYKYGAPSQSRRGFTYSHPLPPIDVRDLDRAPGNVAKFDGLSFLVKRSLLNPKQDSGETEDTEEVEDEEITVTKQSPMRRRANEIADEAVKILVESIDEGGHGPVSPLTMTISIGSEYGRHRSVVLVEHLAVILRARLRRNDGRSYNETSGGTNGIVNHPVSVGTRHRDIQAKHTDEEAFGEDLKREYRKAEKAKKKEAEWSWGGDDDSW
ncbi:hypothetical protein THAOC_33759 [Thalassiosira oceanica]|uniref:RRM domain-containing protein n=1 Tax=Thalassiosira oceanica TaxID=159749 RepID=K0RLC5_THAOC|nr:hypothetical protein THAOC_33759 [Thalassiosira oceanica]|eukprot:EJK47512.1 hypothetical protein THAOC_33759 [Thalassiosira oceanica]